MLKTLRLTCALLIGSGAGFAETSQIDWVDLVDQSKQIFEDPYAELDYNQLSEVVQVARMQEALAGTELSEEARTDTQERLAASRDVLKEQGIDVDWLISQRWIVAERREAAAVSANPAMDGKEVTLAGFAIAAPPDPDGASVVYLVPERGMCSHIPPPAPNQMVRVRLQNGWTPRWIHEPVQLTGKLSVDWSDESVFVVDGPVPMRASFALEAHQVEQSLTEGSASPAQGWATRLQNQPSVSGHLPENATQ